MDTVFSWNNGSFVAANDDEGLAQLIAQYGPPHKVCFGDIETGVIRRLLSDDAITRMVSATAEEAGRNALKFGHTLSGHTLA